MSHQFKAGDLVLITASENFGRCAEVITAHVGPCRATFKFGDWQEIPAGVTAFVVSAEKLTAIREKSGRLFHVNELAYTARWLKPLRGDFAPEQQKTQAVPA